MSEVALVPQLRFPEFGGEWEEKKLGSIATFFNSMRVPLTESDRIKGVYPYYGASGVIDYVEDYIFNGEYILLGEDGANIVLRNSRLVFLAKGKFWVNNHAHIFQSKESNYFLCEALERINYSKYNTGTAQPKLNSDVVKKIKLNQPTLPEQQKIAAFLSAVDNKIELLRQKQALLGEYKKGVMQQIFSQNIRFRADDGSDFPDWEEKKLSSQCVIKKGSQLNKEYLTDEGDYPALNGGINPSGYTTNWNTEASTITISEGGNSCGFVNFVTTRFWSGGHNYSLQELKKSIDANYMYQYLKFNELQIMRLRVGSGLPNIQKGEVSNFKVKLPSLVEQNKIANFLSSIDNKTLQVGKQLDESKQFKKALLQQMFV